MDVLPRERESFLLEQALEGDRDAFGELVVLHQPRSLALATGLVGNREEARDLVQEACLKAFRALHTFVPGRPFFPWFYRILRNACIQHLRARKVRRKVSLQRKTGDDEFVIELDDPTTAQPHEIVSTDESTEVLAAALVQLSKADYEILTLKHFEGLSYKEIAAALTIPVGTVMSRLHTARKRLRNLVPELA